MSVAKRKGIDCSAYPLGIRSNRLRLHQGRFRLDIRKLRIIARRGSTNTHRLRSFWGISTAGGLWVQVRETALSSGLELILPPGRGTDQLISSDPFHFWSLGSFSGLFFWQPYWRGRKLYQHLKQQNIYSFYAAKHTINKSNYVYDLLMAPLMS